MSNKKIDIYICVDENLDRQNQSVLLDIKPKSLMLDVQKRRAKNPIVPKSINRPELLALPGNYQACSAFHTLAENCFVVRSPIDAKIKIDNNGTIVSVIPERNSHFFHERISSIENAFSFDFLFSLCLFAEEKVEVSLTPPFLHQQNQQQHGYISSIKFDISSWFRPFVFIYQLWEGINEIDIKAGEPIAYLTFHTDKKIMLKEFKLNPFLVNSLQACLIHKQIIPLETMKQLYDRFNRTRMNSRILSEIKKNLV